MHKDVAISFPFNVNCIFLSVLIYYELVVKGEKV